VRILHSISIYAISTLINALVRFAILAVGARVLLLEDYGALDTLLFIGLALSSLIIMGYDSAVLRLSFGPEAKDRHQSSLLANALSLILANAFLFTVISVLVVPFLNHSALRMESSILIACCISFGVGFSLIAVSSANLRAHFEEKRFLAATLICAIIRVGGLLPFLKFGPISLQTFMVTVSTCYLLSGLVFVTSNKKWLEKPKLDKELMRQMINFGIPIGAVVVMAGAFPLIERLIVLHTSDITQLSIYAASAFPAMALGVAIQIVNLAWTPLALKSLDTSDKIETFIGKSAMIFQGAFIILYVMLLFSSEYVVEVFVPIGIEGSSRFFPFIGLVVLVRFTSTFTGFGLIVEKRTYVKALINAMGLIIGGTGSLMIGSRFGVGAIPITLFVFSYFTFVLEAFIARKYAPQIIVPYKRMALLILMTSILASLYVSFS
jgi:O-antigen/teichoic acid export membrane protein|tara:strand:+ start:4438 stop:5748 length:1311 start_codon:yes stop_codon:yes gene_type:complete